MKYLRLTLIVMAIGLSGCATTENGKQDHTALFVAIGVAVVVGSIAASSGGGGGNNSNCVEPIIVNGSPGGTPTVCK